MLGALGKLGSVGNGATLPRRVRAILNKYGATLLLPGVSGALRFGYQPGNYRESTGQTLAAADQQVGLVVDAAVTVGPELSGGLELPANWSMMSNAVIDSGTLVLPNAGAQIASNLPIVTAGKTYEIKFNVLSATNAYINVYAGNGAIFGITTVGAKTVRLKAINSGLFVIQQDGGAVGSCSISNISVRELPGIHASQSTSGFQPVLRNTSGIQSWQFDGTDDRLSLSAVPFQMAEDHFVVMGLSSEDVYAERRPFFVRNGATMFGITFGGSGQNTLAANWIDDAGLNCSVSSANAVQNNTNYAVSMRKVGNSKTLRRDGVQLGLNTVQLGTATLGAAVPFIGMENGVSRPFRGPIHGVIFGKGAITDSELLTLERFMATLQWRTL